MRIRLALQPHLRHARVNGTDLAYAERGRGVPVVFVHGGFSDYRCWESQVQAFSKNYRAISYSMRYHYPNRWGKDGSDYALPVHTKDLAALIEFLNASPAHIVGHSYGGRIALHLARDRPDLVRTLTLAEPALISWLQQTPDGPALVADLKNNYFEPATKAIENGNLELAIKLFVVGIGGAGCFEKLPNDVRRRYMDNIRVQAIPSSSAPFTREDAGRISAPVLLLSGELTTRVSRMVVDELGKCLPYAEREEVPGASHLMTVFNSDSFNRMTASFIAKHC